jgi:hypothetical protein
VIDIIGIPNQARHVLPDFRFVEKPDNLVAVPLQAPDDKLVQITVEDVGEIVNRVRLAGIAHRLVGPWRRRGPVPKRVRRNW